MMLDASVLIQNLANITDKKELKYWLTKRQNMAFNWLILTNTLMEKGDEKSQEVLDAIMHIAEFDDQRDIFLDMEICLKVLQEKVKIKRDLKTIGDVKTLVTAMLCGWKWPDTWATPAIGWSRFLTPKLRRKTKQSIKYPHVSPSARS